MSEHDARPTEEQIEALLEGWQPQPSARLQRRVAALPWNQRSTTMKRRRLRWAVAMVAIIVLLISVTLAVPSLRAVAAQMLGFVNAESDRVEETLTFGKPLAPLDSVAAVEDKAGLMYASQHTCRPDSCLTTQSILEKAHP